MAGAAHEVDLWNWEAGVSRPEDPLPAYMDATRGYADMGPYIVSGVEPWNPDDVWEALRTAMDPDSPIEQARQAKARIEDRYLVNGFLLLTARQFAEVHRMAQRQADLRSSPPSFDPAAIPVLVVPANGRPVDVGSGKHAVCVNERIYVLDAEKMPEVNPSFGKFGRLGRYAEG